MFVIGKLAEQVASSLPVGCCLRGELLNPKDGENSYFQIVGKRIPDCTASQRHLTEDTTLHSHHRENLKSHIILLVALYRYGIQVIILREERRLTLKELEISVLRRTFGPKRREVT
jgi:hypothetical protein